MITVIKRTWIDKTEINSLYKSGRYSADKLLPSPRPGMIEAIHITLLTELKHEFN